MNFFFTKQRTFFGLNGLNGLNGFLGSFLIFVCSLFSVSLLIPPSLSAQTGFIRTDGTLLRDEAGGVYRIKGIAFGNNVWSNPSDPVRTHHNESDYIRLKQMGFNSIRFYINYGLFESDANPYHYKESGFAWLDQNIAWAKKYNIRLIINMHYPQGGFQSNGDGGALWNNQENQKRLTALWKEIAKRYADEPVILGYSLLNEPFLEHSFKEYEKLLKGLVREIRLVDSRHIIIIEKANGLRWTYNDNENGNLNFVKIKDSNIIYEFHFYEPHTVTHQNASWTGQKGLFAVYPDPSKYKISGDSKWESTTWESPALDVKDPSLKGKWVFLKSPLIKVSDAKFSFGVPTFQAAEIGERGSASAKGFVIEEFDRNKKLIRTIDVNPEESGIYYWSSNKTGTGGPADKNGEKYLRIKGSTGDANLSYSGGKFPVERGRFYRVSGYLRSDNCDPGATIKLRLDFYSLKGDIFPLNKNYLEQRLKRFIDWGKKNDVPLYLGEFGMIADGFNNNRGGLTWVEDMLDICEKYNINFNYHTYHEYKTFGLYRTAADQLPGDPNLPLVNLFTRKLSGQ